MAATLTKALVPPMADMLTWVHASFDTSSARESGAVKGKLHVVLSTANGLNQARRLLGECRADRLCVMPHLKLSAAGSRHPAGPIPGRASRPTGDRACAAMATVETRPLKKLAPNALPGRPPMASGVDGAGPVPRVASNVCVRCCTRTARTDVKRLCEVGLEGHLAVNEDLQREARRLALRKRRVVGGACAHDEGSAGLTDRTTEMVWNAPSSTRTLV